MLIYALLDLFSCTAVHKTRTFVKRPPIYGNPIFQYLTVTQCARTLRYCFATLRLLEAITK